MIGLVLSPKTTAASVFFSLCQNGVGGGKQWKLSKFRQVS